MISLRELMARAYPERAASDIPETPVTGIECDSRKVEKGFLFVAVRGARQDGRTYIEEAVRRGASAVVSEEMASLPSPITSIRVPESRGAAARLADAFYDYPSRSLRVVGITGTNGKTTSSYLLEHLLRKAACRPGVIGTVNYRFGGKEMPAVETTPGPLMLQRLLAQMRGQGCDFAVLEVSSHALDQKRVEGIRFEAALFTNLTQDHLDYHGTLETYFECKSRLFHALQKENAAVLNADDAWAARLAGQLACRVSTYGMDASKAEMAAVQTARVEGGMRAKILCGGRRADVFFPLVGLHNGYNVLGALAVMKALGFDWESLASGLADFPGVPGRLEAVRCGQDFEVFVDFAHTPDGLLNVLSALKPYAGRKMILVFGCGGDRDRGKRPRMAEIASRFCDSIFVTSDNPRSEDPRGIAQEVAAGFPPAFKKVAVILDRSRAIRQALLSARAGDIVLLAGKGHERTQVLADGPIPFNDRTEAEKVLHGH